MSLTKSLFSSTAFCIRLFFSGLLAVAIVTLALTSVSAQDTGGATLRGDVKDQTGAKIPGATVTLTNTATGDARDTKSNSTGAYVFTAVASGNYVLKAEAQGFKTAEQSNLRIAPSENRSADIQL